MRLLRWPALLLLGALLGSSSGASSHSLRYFYTGVSEPGPGLPRFVTVGFVDGQRFSHYDSDTKREMPRAPWMEKVGQEDPQYWDRNTKIFQRWEEVFRAGTATLMERYNQSAGLHTVQLMYGCDVTDGRPSRGFHQYGYDRRDFLAFDKETLSWTAADKEAGITRDKWDANSGANEYWRNYLEQECPEWLLKYLDYGRDTLQRKVPPEVKVTRKDSDEGLETLLCQAHGFYPKEIDVTWRKDGEVRHEDTFHGVASPNPDGTYYTWLSIKIDPQERSSYRCHVEHDGLQEPLVLAVEEPASVLVWLIAVGAVLLTVVLVVAGIILCIKKQQKKQEKYSCKAASTSGQISSSYCATSSDKASPLLGV